MADLHLPRAALSPETAPRPQAAWDMLRRTVRGWTAVWRQRRHLDRLPDHLRRDIGLSDHEIAAESARPIWDVPSTWRF